MQSEFRALHERDRSFHHSEAVEQTVDYLRQNGERINQPEEKLAAYIGFLADREYVNDGILTGNQFSVERQVASHIIRAKDIGESYFELQKRILVEQGYGEVTVTNQMRQELANAVVNGQQETLRAWTSYLTSEDAPYPDWFKTYTFNSVTKLADLDDEKGSFKRRSTGTAAAFPELNPEALAKTYDLICRAAGGVLGVEDEGMSEELMRRAKGANFAKLYGYVYQTELERAREARISTDGQWIRHKQSSDIEDAKRLARSLDGYGTTWCTAITSTAAMQLSSGDFDVFYTADEEGSYKIPRIAVRMMNGQVAEVRGVARGQGMEDAMIDIAAGHLDGLPGGELYNKRAMDMRRVTELSEKTAAMQPLTVEDIEFLYEFNGRIEGFAMYGEDPRVAQLRMRRSKTMDYQTLLNHLGQEAFVEKLATIPDGTTDLMRMLQSFEADTIDHDFVAEQIIKNAPAEYFANKKSFNLQRLKPLDEIMILVGQRDGKYYLGRNYTALVKKLDVTQKKIVVGKLIDESAYHMLYTRLPHVGLERGVLKRLIATTISEGSASLMSQSFKYILDELGSQYVYDVLIAGKQVDLLLKQQKKFDPGVIDLKSMLEISLEADNVSLYGIINEAGKEHGKRVVYEACMRHGKPEALVQNRNNPNVKLTKAELKEIAVMLCEQGKIGDYAAEFAIDQIPVEYHQEFAEALLSRGDSHLSRSSSTSVLLRSLNKAVLSPGFHQKIYAELMGQLDECANGRFGDYKSRKILHAILINIQYFEDGVVDYKRIADECLQLGLYKELATHSYKFTSEQLDIALLADKLRQNGQEDLIIKNLTVKDIQSTTGIDFIETDNEFNRLAIGKNISKIIAQSDPTKLASKLIENDMDYLVLDNMRAFLRAAEDEEVFLDYIEGLGINEGIAKYRTKSTDVEHPGDVSDEVELVNLDDPALFLDDNFADEQDY